MILAESFIGNPKIPEESDGMEIDLQSISQAIIKLKKVEKSRSEDYISLVQVAKSYYYSKLPESKSGAHACIIKSAGKFPAEVQHASPISTFTRHQTK